MRTYGCQTRKFGNEVMKYPNDIYIRRGDVIWRCDVST